MSPQPRGADLLVRALARAGVRRLFTVSGNQIMSVFDACLDARVELLHVRHEAAAVHMAEAWFRLTGEPGVALVTAGPGHANALSALFTAQGNEAAVLLLSGHAPAGQLGRRAFQEMPQAELAQPLTKAAWTATDPAGLGHDMARALRCAGAGRPGPVHVSLPANVLEARVADGDVSLPEAADFAPPRRVLGEDDARTVVAALGRARRPLIVAAPALVQRPLRASRRALEDALGVPVLAMESPRRLNDPAQGTFGEMVAQADLIVLLGKTLDYRLHYGAAPAVAAECRFIHIDPEAGELTRTRENLAAPERLLSALEADVAPAAEALAKAADGLPRGDPGWRAAVAEAVAYRPEAWARVASPPAGPLHPLDVFRPLQQALDEVGEAVFVSDGGEYGQWAQACLSAPERLIQGPAGSIGTALPYAMAARLARPEARIVATLGDGTFGYHMAEYDTAVRYGLPFVAVVGNDACWNAERTIQLRDYGPERLVGCDLRATRYDRVAAALGAHGEHVDRPGQMAPALARAFETGRPACVDVALEPTAAPTYGQ